MPFLDNEDQITVTTYEKPCCLSTGKLPDIVVTEINGGNVTCTRGCSVIQIISKTEAFRYINCKGGYK